jgi:hypothetical protein
MGKSVAASLTPRLLDSPQPSRMSHLVANFSLTALLVASSCSGGDTTLQRGTAGGRDHEIAYGFRARAASSLTTPSQQGTFGASCDV